MKQFWKSFLLWSALNTGIIAVPSLLLPLLATGGPDIDGLELMAHVAARGVVLGVGFVVLPSALLTTMRSVTRSSSWHFIPYLAMVPYAVAAMAAVGIFFGYLLVLQLISTVVMHGMIAHRLHETA
ncbi:hypothetical protein [Glycomyces sp. MUSA5-2]|uniref:hypothetical protein n=1 Tax=Glycomyces sp. MUSA5-2 TaxID=2053002 RepID=UPI003008B9D8